MASNASTHAADDDRQWFIVGRWHEYEGEARANLLRIAGIGAFYCVELANYYAGAVDRPFHQAVTGLALLWAMVGLGVLYCLGRQIFPEFLKFVSTAADVVLLTAILTVVDGPKSLIVVGYFLVIAVATLRFNLRLIWFATVGTMAGYLWLLGFARWFTQRDIRIPRDRQAILLLALALTGIILGQVIRRVRKMAREYAARLGRGDLSAEAESGKE